MALALALGGRAGRVARLEGVEELGRVDGRGEARVVGRLVGRVVEGAGERRVELGLVDEVRQRHRRHPFPVAREFRGLGPRRVVGAARRGQVRVELQDLDELVLDQAQELLDVPLRETGRDEGLAGRDLAAAQFVEERRMDVPVLRLARGSSHGVICGEEVWFLVHLVSYESPRRYYHAVVVMDRNVTQVRRVSHPFTLEGQPIEYCGDMSVKGGDLKRKLCLHYSVRDQDSSRMEFPEAALSWHRS